MATINNKNGKLQLDFRYKGKRCREQTKLEDRQLRSMLILIVKSN